MRTTMAMVFEALGERYLCVKGSSYNPDTIAASVLALSSVDDDDYSNTAVVVAVENQNRELRFLRRVPSERLVLICPQGTNLLYSCAFCVYGEFSAAEIVQTAEYMLCFYRSWYSRLSSDVLDGISIEELINSVHMFVGNPIIVLDRALRVRACTDDDVMDDEMWTPLNPQIEAFAAPADPPGYVDFVKLLDSEKTVLDYCMFNGVHLAACRTCDIAGEYLFACLIQKNKPIGESDVSLLKILIVFIETLMRTGLLHARQEGIGYNGLLIDALEGHLNNPVELGNRMSALGYSLKPRLQIIVLMPSKGRINDRQARRIVSDISFNFPFGKCVHYEGAIIIFLTYEVNKGPRRLDYKKLETFMGKNNLVAGVSGEFSVNTPLQEIYQTAQDALKIGRVALKDSHLFFFDKCRAFYLYEMCSQEGDCNFYIHSALKIVASHDREAKASLYPTLKSLAENWGNRTKAANELFMQRNTLQARIREIELLCGIDLSDPAIIAHLHHSFALREYCKEPMFS